MLSSEIRRCKSFAGSEREGERERERQKESDVICSEVTAVTSEKNYEISLYCTRNRGDVYGVYA